MAKYFGFSIFGSKYYKCIKCSFGNYLRSFFFLLCGLTCGLNDQEEAECRDLGEF